MLVLAGVLVLLTPGCRSTTPAAEEPTPEPSGGGAALESAPPRVLATSPVARLLLPAEHLFREDGDTFSVRFRLENTSEHSLSVDLASPTLVGPQQWGPLSTEERQVVDESRHGLGELTGAERAALREAQLADRLTELPPGDSIDLYVPFHGTEARMFMGFATPYVFVSLDGAIDVVDPDGVATRLSLAWTTERTSTDTDIVHRMPVVLAERDCRRKHTLSPRQGRPEWPVVYCPVR